MTNRQSERSTTDSEDTDSAKLERRSYLKLAGIATASLAAPSGVVQAGSSGYGADGYGSGGYGDPTGLSVATEDETQVSDTSATFNGKLTDLDGASSVDVFFQYRQTGSSTWSSTSAKTLTSTGSFSQSVDGLSAGTEYEFRAVANASDGDTDTGSTLVFTTDGSLSTSSALTVSTSSASSVGETSATLNGSLDDLGGASSADCYFQYRETGTSTWTATSAQTLSATGSYSETVTLEDGVEYEYRAVADASDGDTDTGSTVTFTTTEHSVAVSTGDASNVGEATASITGSLDDLGNATSADCYFQYRQSGGSWTATTVQTLSSTGTYNQDLSGLNSGTEYEYRAVAKASDGDADTGNTRTFTTTSPPAIDSYSVTEAGSPNPHTEITADWAVSDAGGDLDTVRVAVYDSSGNLVDSARTNVSGSSASGTDKFKIKHTNGQTFDVRLAVTDAANNTTSQTKTVSE